MNTLNNLTSDIPLGQVEDFYIGVESNGQIAEFVFQNQSLAMGLREKALMRSNSSQIHPKFIPNSSQIHPKFIAKI